MRKTLTTLLILTSATAVANGDVSLGQSMAAKFDVGASAGAASSSTAGAVSSSGASANGGAASNGNQTLQSQTYFNPYNDVKNYNSNPSYNAQQSSTSFNQVRQAPGVSPIYGYGGGSDSCRTSSGGGASSPFGGLTMMFGNDEINCQRLKVSRRFEELGLNRTACELLAIADDDISNQVRAALQATGESCAVAAIRK